MQTSLFKTEPLEPQARIPGLTYLPDFVTATEEKALLEIIDAQPWLSDLKRRVQHYGYKYDYKARAISEELYLGPLPSWLAEYAERLHSQRLFTEKPDQAIVNEYHPGQGISPHIDCVPCFTETIASLSLGSACVMDFARPNTGAKTSMLLEPRSLIVLTDDARYHWMHAIAARKSDKFDGTVILRARRVSLTFRKTAKH